MAFLNDSLLDPSTPESQIPPDGVRFDDPPGYSPGRWTSTLFDRDETLDALRANTGNRVKYIDVQGVFSGAYSGEAYLIAVFILGGVAGGLLGAIGQDLWTATKAGINKLLTRHGAPHNLIEVAIEFKEYDVIFHAESTTSKDLPAMFDDADAVLERLAGLMADPKKFPKGARTIEIRASTKRKNIETSYYSYRRIERLKGAAKPIDIKKNIPDEGGKGKSTREDKE